MMHMHTYTYTASDNLFLVCTSKRYAVTPSHMSAIRCHFVCVNSIRITSVAANLIKHWTFIINIWCHGDRDRAQSIVGGRDHRLLSVPLSPCDVNLLSDWSPSRLQRSRNWRCFYSHPDSYTRHKIKVRLPVSGDPKLMALLDICNWTTIFWCGIKRNHYMWI